MMLSHGRRARFLRRSRNVAQLPAVRLPAVGVGAQAIGTMALAAVAVGALAIGTLAIGQLAIGRARIRRLEIDELVVRRLRVTEQLLASRDGDDGGLARSTTAHDRPGRAHRARRSRDG